MRHVIRSKGPVAPVSVLNTYWFSALSELRAIVIENEQIISEIVGTSKVLNPSGDKR